MFWVLDDLLFFVSLQCQVLEKDRLCTTVHKQYHTVVHPSYKLAVQTVPERRRRPTGADGGIHFADSWLMKPDLLEPPKPPKKSNWQTKMGKI
eukprot:5982147-Amphidinium_carterae.1